jgi:hypothetical protein
MGTTLTQQDLFKVPDQYNPEVIHRRLPSGQVNSYVNAHTLKARATSAVARRTRTNPVVVQDSELIRQLPNT